jgi:autotransporter-associated beta strand protein
MPATISPDQFLDPLWRISNLYTCLDKRGRLVPFRLWDEQREFLTNIHARNDILKCRQRGFTTLMGIVQLDDCVFTPNVRAAIIAHRMDDAKVIFRDKVKLPYDNLDEGIRQRITAVQDSADTLTLSNNSSFRVSTSVRSGTLNWLHVSEYGKICAQFPEKARELKTGSFPAAEQGVITIESTAEGEGGDFYEMTQTAQRHLTKARS